MFVVRRPQAAAVVAMVALCGAQLSLGCVWLMGEARDSVMPNPAGTWWNWGFRGDDWVGVDGNNQSWSCATGKKQSPLNLYGYDTLPKASSGLKTEWSYSPLTSDGTNIQVFNNGHVIQVQWTGALESNTTIVSTGAGVTDVLKADDTTEGLKRYKLTPLQFHFHTVSEHAVDGVNYPLEMHIVHVVPQEVLPGCPSSGCLSVTGVLFKLTDELEADNPFLEAIWAAMPEREGVVSYLKPGQVLDIEALLPEKMNRGYMQYEGSLTTPPCSEGLLWHVMKTPVTISRAQYNRHSRAVGSKECKEIQNVGTFSVGRRRLSEGDHAAHQAAHHDHDHDDHVHVHSDAHARLATFERGSYSGFVPETDLVAGGHVAPHVARKVLGVDGFKQASDPSNPRWTWQCEVKSYGQTSRNVQMREGRTVLAFE